MREQFARVRELLPESQGHYLAVAVLHVPSLLDGGSKRQRNA